MPRPSAIAALVVALWVARASADPPAFWTVTPYRVRIELAAGGAVAGSPAVVERIAQGLRERLAARVGAFWRSEVRVASGSGWPSVRSMALGAHAAGAPAPPADEDPGPRPDKWFFLYIADSPGGVAVAAREFDQTLSHWGAPTRLEVASTRDLPERAFDAVVEAFHPIASFDLDPSNDRRVLLSYRAQELAGGVAIAASEPGSVLLPYVRRTPREGRPDADSVKRVPWTYLIVATTNDPAAGSSQPEGDSQADESLQIEPPNGPPEESGPAGDTPLALERAWPADVYSHKRAPFGARRRGGVDQLALVVDRDPQRRTVLRLHSRLDPRVGLAGYEVLLGPPGDPSPESLGRTDSDGRVTTPPGEWVAQATVRAGSSVVASLPIVAGVEAIVEAPLPDERQRLAAEVKLGVLRDDLIDLVARRRILAARVRTRIESGKLDDAQRLLDELDTLPGRPQFNQRIDAAEQFFRADDPIVQKRVTRLIEQTRAVLGAALDPRDTRDLKDALREARLKPQGLGTAPAQPPAGQAQPPAGEAQPPAGQAQPPAGAGGSPDASAQQPAERGA